MKPRLSKLIFLVPIGLAAITLFVFLGGQIVRLLWNGLLPPLFGWPEVTFWQAVGLLALCRILFGGFTFRDGDKRSSMRIPMADHGASINSPSVRPATGRE